MKSIIFYFIIIVYIIGCGASSKMAFEQARWEDTVKGYELFIKDYPESIEAPLAKNRIEELQYTNVKNSGRYSQLEMFLKCYPNSVFKDSVQELLNKFKLLKIDRDTLFDWQLFGLNIDGEPDCICQVNSSIAISDEGKKAFSSLLVRKDKEAQRIFADFFDVVAQLQEAVSKTEFTWELFPDGENDFLLLQKGSLSNSSQGAITVQAPTEFRSKINERVFRTHSDWILGRFSLGGITGKRFFRIDGDLGTLNGNTNTVNCKHVQVLGTFRFPKDTWIPFHAGSEFNNGGVRFDSTGITLLRGTLIRLSK
jgi:hypothetical protein